MQKRKRERESDLKKYKINGYKYKITDSTILRNILGDSSVKLIPYSVYRVVFTSCPGFN